MLWIQIFDVVWLMSLLGLLLLIWRSSERRNKTQTAMEQTLVEVSAKNAESVRQSINALIETINMLKSKGD